MTRPKVLERSSSKLVVGISFFEVFEYYIATNPLYLLQLLIYCFPIGFLISALLAIFHGVSGAGVVRLNCNRLEPTIVQCKETRSHFFDFTETSPVVMQPVLLTGVGSEEVGESTTYWLAISTRSGSTRSQMFRNYSGVADRINQFLNSDRPSLAIAQNNYLASVFWIAGGLVVASFALWLGVWLVLASLPLTFDKRKRTLLKLGKTISLDDIEAIALQVGIDWQTGEQTSRLGLLAKMDTYIPISSQWNSVRARSYEYLFYPTLADGQFLLQTIQEFLEVPDATADVGTSNLVFLNSEKMSPLKRNQMVYDRQQNCFTYGSGECSSKRIQSVHLKKKKDEDGDERYSRWWVLAQLDTGEFIEISQGRDDKTIVSHLKALSQWIDVPIVEDLEED